MALGDGQTVQNPADKRRAVRRRVLFSGKLVSHDGASTIDCTIRDLSSVGAKVRLAGTAPAPTDLWLIEVREGLAFQCRIAWRDLPDVGLDFLSSYELKDADTPELRMLKRIWIENAPR